MIAIFAIVSKGHSIKLHEGSRLRESNPERLKRVSETLPLDYRSRFFYYFNLQTRPIFVVSKGISRIRSTNSHEKDLNGDGF